MTNNPLFNKSYKLFGLNDFDMAIKYRYMTCSIFDLLPLSEVFKRVHDGEPLEYYSDLLNSILLITVVPLNKEEKARLEKISVDTFDPSNDGLIQVRIKSIGKIEGK